MLNTIMTIIMLLVPCSTFAGQLLTISLKDSSQVLWEKEVDPGDPIWIVHRNSIFGALVWEALELDGQGFLWLKGVKTDHPAVLEYYGLEEVSNQWISLERKFEHLAIRVTLNGEFWICLGKEEVPLSFLIADGSLVEVRGSQAR
jgi:hypothetical protein